MGRTFFFVDWEPYRKTRSRARFARHLDRPVLGEFSGVAEQVVEDVLQFDSVAVDFAQVVGKIYRELIVALLDQGRGESPARRRTVPTRVVIFIKIIAGR